MLLRSKLVAAVCAVGLVPVVAVKVMAADPPQHLGEGVAVGTRAAADPALQIRQATSSYYVTSYGQPDDYSPELWEILSSTSGALVRTAPRSNDEAPALLGKYVVTPAAGEVSFRDIATDAVSQVAVPAEATYQGTYPGGVLLSRAADSSLVLRSVDNTEKPITGLTFGDPVILDTTATAVLIAIAGRLSVVDTATGTATATATLPANPAWAALTPNRVLWQTAAAADSKTVGWKQGAATGTVEVPFGLPLLTVGDDLAVRVPESKQLTKIAANGGAVTPNFVTGVHDAADLSNGRLLVSAQSKVASVGADGVLTTVKATPAFAAQVSGVGMSGARVVTADYQPDHGVYETTTNGTTWSSLSTSNSTKPLQLEGTSLVTYQAGIARVRGSAGDLTFPAADEVVLGKGGKLVSHRTPNAATAEVYDVATKTKLADYEVPFALADSSVWKVTTPGALTGKDLSTQATKTIAVASGCAVGADQVNGRWALLSGCNGGNQVVDVKGPEAPRNLTVAADSQLGNGFVVQTSAGEDANGLSTKELLVTDLNDQGLGQRRYGPINGRLLQPASFRPDGAGGAKLIYADPDARPRIISLTWLKADPQQGPDTTAPVLTSATAGDRLRDNTSLSFDWDYTDPQDPNAPATGVLSYDLRIQQRDNRTSPYGAWNQVPSWQGLRTKAASYSAVPGTDTCWQVRARDYAGNLSAWSPSYCSEVDGIAPVAVTLRIGDRVQLGTPATVRWSYTDETSVASYDVVYKTAAAGAAFGKWIYPAVWQNTDLKSISWAPRLGMDECFMVRARDVLGNLSAWSPPLCTVVPQDDRALVSSGTVVRSTSTLAFQGTTSDLKANGAFLTKTAEAGLRIALVTINGPGQGKVDVYHANVKIGTVSLAGTTTERKVTYLPITVFRTGAVKIVSTSTAPARIDGVAFLRY